MPTYNALVAPVVIDSTNNTIKWWNTFAAQTFTVTLTSGSYYPEELITHLNERIATEDPFTIGDLFIDDNSEYSSKIVFENINATTVYPVDASGWALFGVDDFTATPVSSFTSTGTVKNLLIKEGNRSDDHGGYGKKTNQIVTANGTTHTQLNSHSTTRTISWSMLNSTQCDIMRDIWDSAALGDVEIRFMEDYTPYVEFYSDTPIIASQRGDKLKINYSFQGDLVFPVEGGYNNSGFYSTSIDFIRS